MDLQPVDYDQRQHQAYARGRAMDADMRDAWMAAFAARLPRRRPLAVLDLGSGVGRLTPALAQTFGGPVTGVEPAAAMRAQAEAHAPHPHVRYLAGSAEAIPMPAASVDVVLMFLSFHHMRYRPRVAAEIARVLRRGGRVLIRSPFGDRLPGGGWHRYFPRAPEIERAMFPTLAEVEAVFAPVGLKRVALDEIQERYAPSLAAYAPKLRLRAISTFEHMTEAEIAEGFAALEAAVAAEVEPEPVVSRSDLLVLG